MKNGFMLSPFVLTLCLLFTLTWSVAAQNPDQPPVENYMSERARAMLLVEQRKMIEALPILEKLHAANPKDRQVMEALASAVFVNSVTLTDAEARKQARRRARAIAVRLQEQQGEVSNLMKMLLELPEDGSEPAGFSSRKEVDEAMKEGEAAFARGDFKKALAAYERALKLDPQQYYAALFIGDVYFKQERMDQAGEWFAKAIAINPDLETAHRYWGDALMKSGKKNEARDKFIDAIIAEPYTRTAWVGLIQWGEHHNVQLAHPRMDIPVSVERSEKDKNTINLNLMIGDSDKKDGSFAWVAYSMSRAHWKMDDKKFKEAFPNEKQYRHSLTEEVGALRLAADTLLDRMKDGEVKEVSLTPSLANLLRLHKAGLLEAFVLLAKPDAGIAQDYEAYRKNHRDRLRQYLTDYVTAGSR